MENVASPQLIERLSDILRAKKVNGFLLGGRSEPVLIVEIDEPFFTFEQLQDPSWVVSPEGTCSLGRYKTPATVMRKYGPFDMEMVEQVEWVQIILRPGEQTDIDVFYMWPLGVEDTLIEYGHSYIPIP